jgi:ribokinase
VAECLEHIKVPTVVVTLGPRGCCARHLGQLVLHTAYSIVPVDTTAAGDTFCGALVAALSRGLALEQALGHASAAGALACTQLGAQTSVPRHDEVELLMAQQPLQQHVALISLRSYCGLGE